MPLIAIDSGVITALASMTAPISFSDRQFEAILIAAAALPRARRDAFLRAVAGRLPAQPSDAEVWQAAAGALG